MGIRKVQTAGYNPTGNSTVERFHRYLSAALSIVYTKQTADWDEYIAPILFSYRASQNDATGYSPFFLETGREPQLPIHTLFSELRPKAMTEEHYVGEITRGLSTAFEYARNRQYEMSEKNKLRKDEDEYKPDFKEGDLLLIWERASAESRLKSSNGTINKTSKLPRKLQNPFQGP